MFRLMKYFNQLKVIPFMHEVTIRAAGTCGGLLNMRTNISFFFFFSIHPTCIISKTELCHTIFFFFFSEKFHNIMLIVYHEEIKKRE